MSLSEIQFTKLSNITTKEDALLEIIHWWSLSFLLLTEFNIQSESFSLKDCLNLIKLNRWSWFLNLKILSTFNMKKVIILKNCKSFTRIRKRIRKKSCKFSMRLSNCRRNKTRRSKVLDINWKVINYTQKALLLSWVHNQRNKDFWRSLNNITRRIWWATLGIKEQKYKSKRHHNLDR